MTIDSTGRYLYIVNEFGNSVYSFMINSQTGVLTFVEKIRLTEEVESYAADIHFSLDEQYLYVSLRGSDEIVQLSVNSGKMEIIGKFHAGGKWPRSFKLSPDGKYLFVANQNSNNISAFEVNLNDGSLSDEVASLEVFRPTSIATYIE